jgi:hypothetical protein
MCGYFQGTDNHLFASDGRWLGNLRAGDVEASKCQALFSWQNFGFFFATVSISFLFDKHCPITE